MTKKRKPNANPRSSSQETVLRFLKLIAVKPHVRNACKTIGIHYNTPMNWVIRSKKGDPELQEIEFPEGIIAPFHVCYETAKFMAVEHIEQAALDRALNGSEVPSMWQGKRVLKENPKFVGFSDKEMTALGFDPIRDRLMWTPDGTPQYEMMEHKPSDQLVIKTLESFKARWRPKQQVEVQVGGVLRISRERILGDGAKAVEAKAVTFEGNDETGSPDEFKNCLALPPPAKTDADFDAAVAAGAFTHREVAFIDPDGSSTVLSAGRDPLLPPPDSDEAAAVDQPGDSPQVKELRRQLREKLHGKGHRTHPGLAGPPREAACRASPAAPRRCPRRTRA